MSHVGAESVAAAESPNMRDALVVTSLSLTATESARAALSERADGAGGPGTTGAAAGGKEAGTGAGDGAGCCAQAASVAAARSAEAVAFTRPL